MTKVEWGGRGLRIDAPSSEWVEHISARVRELRESTPAWMWPEADIMSLPQPPAIKAEPVAPGRKFRRLCEWFTQQTAAELVLEFKQLDELIDGGMPAGPRQVLAEVSGGRTIRAKRTLAPGLMPVTW